ncbi:MAG: hypothetical protein F6K00_17275 [Leptolyngbya sp. SIOISBB]|nr:hypothetical protein [Leptolyngbya sp. SIOISBB]
MNTLDTATKQALQNALYAYINEYGGKSLADARAIAGALLSVQEQTGELAAPGWGIEEWVDDLVTDFDLTQIPSAAKETAAQHLATQAQNWREQLENKVRNTLDAYIQKYAPALDTHTIEQLITTVLPIVEDATITRDEARYLIQTLSHQVDGQAVATRSIDPQWLLLADTVQQVRQYEDLEASAADVMQAYVYQFQPAAVEIGEDLVERAVAAISDRKLQLGLDVDLDPETRKLLVKQVMLKVKLRDSSPPPAKTALEIAQDLHDEVARYRRDRGLDAADYLPPVTKIETPDDSSSLGGEIGVGINLRPSRLGKETDNSAPPSDA